MFVNRIKICPDLHNFSFDFLGLDIIIDLLRQWTHKMGRFLSTLKHSYPIFIWYTNSRLRLEFVFQITIGCSCFNYYFMNLSQLQQRTITYLQKQWQERVTGTNSQSGNYVTTGIVFNLWPP
jgi:hypothetical protein